MALTLRGRSRFRLASLCVLVAGSVWLLVSFGTWAARHPVAIALRMAEGDLRFGVAALRDFRERRGRVPEDLTELAAETGWRAPEYSAEDCAFLGLLPAPCSTSTERFRRGERGGPTGCRLVSMPAGCRGLSPTACRAYSFGAGIVFLHFG